MGLKVSDRRIGGRIWETVETGRRFGKVMAQRKLQAKDR